MPVSHALSQKHAVQYNPSILPPKRMPTCELLLQTAPVAVDPAIGHGALKVDVAMRWSGIPLAAHVLAADHTCVVLTLDLTVTHVAPAKELCVIGR